MAPTVDWFAAVVDKPKLILADEQNFAKQTNRNRIIYGTFQGAKIFTVPVIHNSTGGSYKGVKISYATHWQNQLINALKTAYGKSPFYEYYGYRFEIIFKSQYEYLWDLNLAILQEIIVCLKLELSILVEVSAAVVSEIQLKPVLYYQVFQEKLDFIPHLSVLDLLFNEGPDAVKVLRSMHS